MGWQDGMEFLTSIEAMKQQRERYRQSGQTVVFTNGCFDILHAGHVRYLNEAKKLGDVLVIGLNSDESVRLLKGEGRPVNPVEDRAEVLAGLRAVNHVVAFGEATAEELVRQLQPDIYVKGGDYSLDRLPEADIVASYGGKTVLVPMVEGRSTSNVIRRLSNGAK
jgi:rfaE bifunctional protein nucleotidyltransferase chain/domain